MSVAGKAGDDASKFIERPVLFANETDRVQLQLEEGDYLVSVDLSASSLSFWKVLLCIRATVAVLAWALICYDRASAQYSTAPLVGMPGSAQALLASTHEQRPTLHSP